MMELLFMGAGAFTAIVFMWVLEKWGSYMLEQELQWRDASKQDGWTSYTDDGQDEEST